MAIKQLFQSITQIERVFSSVLRPERFSDLKAVESFIPRGNGLSYVLASASADADATTVLTDKLNRFLDYSELTHELRVEPGVTLGEVLDFLVKKNRWFSVLPGHPSITVGGALGMNVHGKSCAQGYFLDQVRGFRLYHPSHGLKWVDRASDCKTFELTGGGFGLTGLVTEIQLKTMPLPGKSIDQKRIPVADLHEAYKKMKELSKDYVQLYSWHRLSKKASGSGYIFAENYSDQEELGSFKFKPFKAKPGSQFLSLLPAGSLSLINSLYLLLQWLRPAALHLPLSVGTFPIYGKEVYFKLFGRRGFLEYQCLIPSSQTEAFLSEFMIEIKNTAAVITLASLKLFSGERKYLRFTGEGLCLALDCVANPSAYALCKNLDLLVIKHGGIVNLAKDPRIDPSTLQKMYREEYTNFKEDLKNFDPLALMQSELRKRLGI